MRGQKSLMVWACAAIVALSVGVAACGSAGEGSTTTLAPATTASTAPTTTSTVVSTSDTASASSTTALPAVPTRELQAYLDAMKAFGEAFSNGPDTSFLNITDPSTATAADLQQADTASTFIHKLQDQLLAIKAPVVIAALHSQFVSVFQSEVTSMDEFIAALKAKDAATMKTAHDALIQRLETMQPLLLQLLAIPGVK